MRAASTTSSLGKKLRPREEPGGLSGRGAEGRGSTPRPFWRGTSPGHRKGPGLGHITSPEVTKANSPER